MQWKTDERIILKETQLHMPPVEPSALNVTTWRLNQRLKRASIGGSGDADTAKVSRRPANRTRLATGWRKGGNGLRVRDQWVFQSPYPRIFWQDPGTAVVHAVGSETLPGIMLDVERDFSPRLPDTTGRVLAQARAQHECQCVLKRLLHNLLADYSSYGRMNVA